MPIPSASTPRARPKGNALEAAIRTRRSATAQFLAADGADPERPELALIEIDRRRDFAHPLDDPKFAIRLGCADAGVLTQFVLVPKKAKRYNSEKNLDHRVRSGWQDGLRQLGVRVLPEHTLATGIPEGLRYAALWMVKRRKDGPTRLPRHTPVAVMVTPLAPGTGIAAVTGWDPKTAQWIPYPRFLLKLVKIAEIPDIDDDLEAETPGNEAVPRPAGRPERRRGSRITPPSHLPCVEAEHGRAAQRDRALPAEDAPLAARPPDSAPDPLPEQPDALALAPGRPDRTGPDQDRARTAVPSRSRPALDPGTQRRPDAKRRSGGATQLPAG